MKGQVAFEYMAIMGVVLATLIPLFYFVATESSNLQSNVQEELAYSTGKYIVEKSQTIFYLGEHSRTRLEISLPAGIKNITLSSTELVIDMGTSLVIPSTVKLNGTIPITEGIHFINIENMGGYVLLS